jgi:hypothetical protein
VKGELVIRLICDGQQVEKLTFIMDENGQIDVGLGPPVNSCELKLAHPLVISHVGLDATPGWH